MTKKREVINTADAPGAIGPYSQAVLVDGWLYCSGQIPLDPATGQIVPGGIKEQATQVMKNLMAVIKASGGTPADIVKSTIFLKNLGDFSTVNEVYGSFLREPYPARACVEVARLPRDVLVEIEAIAKVL
jgi:2-iminobutanoate/2-iminopropanoate deaminase